MNKLWDFIVRWRTRLFNGICALPVLIAPLLGAPEVQAGSHSAKVSALCDRGGVHHQFLDASRCRRDKG